MVQIPSYESTECIWLAENAVCELMRSCRCRGDACTFRKIAAQSKRSDTAWRTRMTSLPEEQQSKIAKKNYGGNMPWK